MLLFFFSFLGGEGVLVMFSPSKPRQPSSIKPLPRLLRPCRAGFQNNGSVFTSTQATSHLSLVKSAALLWLAATLPHSVCPVLHIWQECGGVPHLHLYLFTSAIQLLRGESRNGLPLSPTLPVHVEKHASSDINKYKEERDITFWEVNNYYI